MDDNIIDRLHAAAESSDAAAARLFTDAAETIARLTEENTALRDDVRDLRLDSWLQSGHQRAVPRR